LTFPHGTRLLIASLLQELTLSSQRQLAAVLLAVTLPIALPLQSQSVISAAAPGTINHTWQDTPLGQPPRNLLFRRGAAVVVEHKGSRFLRAITDTDIHVPLSTTLGARWSVEFDVELRVGHAYPVQISLAREGDRLGFAGASRKVTHAVATCGQIHTGIDGNNQQSRTRVAVPLTEVLRCRLEIEDGMARLYVNGDLLANMTGMDFGRSDKLHIFLPARADEPAFLGELRITAEDGTAPTALTQVSGTGDATVLTAGGQAPSAETGTLTTVTGGTAGQIVGTPATGGSDPGIMKVTFPAQEEATQLRASGVPVSTAAPQLKAKYELDDPSLTTTLLSGGYSEIEVVQWLYGQGRSLAQQIASFEQQNFRGSTQRTENIVSVLVQVYVTVEPMTVALLRNADASADNIVRGLRDAGLTFSGQLQKMLTAFPAMPAAHALWNVHRMPAAQLVEAMHQNGMDAGDVLMALADFYNMPILTAIETLGTRYPADIVLERAGKIAGFTLNSAAAALKAAGHSTQKIALALGKTIERGADAGTVVGTRALYMAIRIMDKTDDGLEAIVTAAFTTMKRPAVEIATVAREGGEHGRKIVRAIAVVTKKTAVEVGSIARAAGIKVGDVAVALHDYAKPAAMTTRRFVAETLRGAGFTATEVATALKEEFQQTAQNTALGLSEAGFTFAQIRDALVAAYVMTVAAVLQMLASLGIT
jgi:hypothetical protein